MAENNKNIIIKPLNREILYYKNNYPERPFIKNGKNI
jgi:hypothetical protein